MLPDPEPEPAPPSGHGPLPRQLLSDQASIEADGRLCIAGVDILQLVEEIGTPAFVYDEEHIRRRCREAVEAWGDGVAYASKAFLCKAMARLAYEEGMTIDVSTGGEMHVALAAGVPGSRLVLHGNNKSQAELERAIEVGVGRIVVDSFDEIARLERAATGSARRPDVLIRVTPGIEAHTHEYVRTGQEDSKFGFGVTSGDAATAVAKLRRAGSPVTVVGLHAHIGSQIFSLGSFEKAVEILGGLLLPLQLEELCLGGGLGVAYVDGEDGPSITQWAATVKAAARAAGIGPEVRLTAEPGRSIVA